WYHQARTPEVICRLAYDRSKATAELTVEQINPETPQKTKPKPLHIPIAMALFDPDGHEIEISDAAPKGYADGVLHLTKSRQVFKFKGIDKRPMLSVLRGFSAPVKMTTPASERQLAFLMANETDAFARWQASNDLITRLLIAQTKRGDIDAIEDRLQIFAEAQAAILSDDTLEAAYRAEILRLPSETDIARELQRNVDPDAIHTARNDVMSRLARINAKLLIRLYEENEVTEAYAPTPEQVGARALRNGTLTYLAARNSAADRARVSAHFEGAKNMTDQAIAFYLLAHSGSKARAAALDTFYEQWSDDHLVLNMWFSAQATSPNPATPGRVRKLLKHPKYSATTPNKIRAVVGGFAMMNPVQFNRADGEGYALVAEQILATDAINPQVAARLCNAFRSWRSLEAGRRKKARAAVKKIASTPDLSRDVQEIAMKILD
ncbi:MAG: DUF3458 domain-containing protein, partial [Pseudomonadota bacterium]